MISAHPLCWPEGWPRTSTYQRKQARFGKGESVKRTYGEGYYTRQRDLTVTDGVERCLRELERMNVSRQDVVISTNVRARAVKVPGQAPSGQAGEEPPSSPGGGYMLMPPKLGGSACAATSFASRRRLNHRRKACHSGASASPGSSSSVRCRGPGTLPPRTTTVTAS